METQPGKGKSEYVCKAEKGHQLQAENGKNDVRKKVGFGIIN